MDKKIVGKLTVKQIVIAVLVVVGVAIAITMALLKTNNSKKTVDTNVANENNMQIQEKTTSQEQTLSKEEQTITQEQTLSSEEQSIQYEKEWKQAYIDFIDNNKIYYDDEIQKKYINLNAVYLYDVDLDGEPELIVSGSYIGYAVGGNSGETTFIFKYKNNNVELIKTVRGFFGILDGKYLVTAVVGSDGVLDTFNTVFYKLGDLEIDNSIKVDCKGYNPTICSFYENDELLSSNELAYVIENMTLSKRVWDKAEEVNNGGILAIFEGDYSTTSILRAGSGKDVEQAEIDAYKDYLTMEDEAKEYINNYSGQPSTKIYFLDKNSSSNDTSMQVKPQNISSEPKTATITGINLNVRTGPATDYNSIMKVTSGDKFEIYGSENGWYYGKTENGTYGWVIQDYVSVDESIETGSIYEQALKAFATYLNNKSNYAKNGGDKALNESSKLLFHDYNEDGIPELVVSDGINYSVFAYVDNRVVNIYSFYANDLIVLCENGISWYSLGSDMHHDGVFIYNGGIDVSEYRGDTNSAVVNWECQLNGNVISYEEFDSAKKNVEAKQLKETFKFKVTEVNSAIEAYKKAH